MIFQKTQSDLPEKELKMEEPEEENGSEDDVETVVGPSVNVEGDLNSAGNIVVKGTVHGSVYTTRHLTVEPGAKIVANIRSGSATVSGEIRGNIKVKDFLQLTSTSKLLGDITAKVFTVEPGAAIYGKITMPGVEAEKKIKSTRSPKKPRIVEE